MRKHLELLALHDAQQLAQELNCDNEAVRRANLMIRRLDPRPGSAFGESDTRYVVADVIVRKIGNKWTALVNPQAVPNIRVNRMYAEALQASRGAAGPLAQHLQEARRLIRNVQQRFDTIQRVAQVIVDRQRLYFDLGDLAIRPLVLRDVARELGLHPSTVSRVSSNKYAQTPTGVVELKRFFSTRASHREGGATCSSAAIRALIRELVSAESPADPLSDVQITRLLASRGISVARRTVAKYRAALRIAAVESRRMTGRLGSAASHGIGPADRSACFGASRGATPRDAGGDGRVAPSARRRSLEGRRAHRSRALAPRTPERQERVRGRLLRGGGAGGMTFPSVRARRREGSAPSPLRVGAAAAGGRRFAVAAPTPYSASLL